MILYRYININDFIILELWAIQDETKKGYWLIPQQGEEIGSVSTWYEGRRFMMKNAKNKFAHESKKEALRGFILRKKRQIKILHERARIANKVLVKAEEMYERPL